MSAPVGSGPAFPWGSVVGLDDAKLALRLAAIDPLIGGVLLRGDKGSAKTTLARGLAGLLGGSAPFVELPLGATEDRLVGSLDTRAALAGGEIRFQPGLLAVADGGVLYVDEINLLPDHLVDVLLDVAVSGENRVERDGVSHRHPARFVLVGSMNPEEGELRPQLLDRFGLCVTVAAPTDPADRAEAVRRRLAFDRGRVAGPAEQVELRSVGPAAIGDEVIVAANRLALAAGTEGLRADLTICRAAAALAGWEGRPETTLDDVRRVAPLALVHRSRRGPFDPPVLPPQVLDQALEHALEPPESDDDPAEQPEDGGSGERPLPLGAARRFADEQRPRPAASMRGRTVGDAPAGPHDPVAVVATARHRAVTGAAATDEGAVRTAVRHAPPRRTVILCVDLSGSMGARQRAEAASGAVLGMLSGAYERRDRVGLVTFRGSSAEVVLTPTASVEVARHRLESLSTGGETPLAEGLEAALAVARREQAGGGEVLLAVLTDGRATGAPDAVERGLAVAARVRRDGIPAVVLDHETGPARLGLAGQLAEAMGARWVPLDAGSPEAVAAAVIR